VSAVAAFVVRGDGRVLYTRRAKDPGKGLLGMPGGFVDPGETAEDALRREVREEVGLELASARYLTSFPNRYTYDGVTYSTLDLFFVASAVDDSRVRALDAVEATLWLDPADVNVEDIAFDSMRQALMVFKAASAAGGRSRRP
jgi:mutator protein MutT